MSVLAFVTPFAAPAARGNAVTVERIAQGLRALGGDVRVWDLSVTPQAIVEGEIAAARPALIHAFHAHRTGPLALRLARRLDVPLIVTLTGTDANHDLFDPERAASLRQVLEGATSVTAFHASIAEQVRRVLPELDSRLVVVPQSVRLTGTRPFDLGAHWSLPADRLLFVLPAAIRPVKAPRRPLAALDPLVAADPRVRLLYVGPVSDPGEGERLRGALVTRPWVRHVGPVPHAEMASLLSQADVVLNCSISEGGMANSVLEALALGRAVLASDIPGNRAIIQDDVTGLCFGADADFTAKAARLARDPELRARLGRAGRALVEREYPPAREIAGYEAVYRRVAAPASA